MHGFTPPFGKGGTIFLLYGLCRSCEII